MFVSGPNASPTTGMTSWIQPDGAHALYVDVNQHVNQFWNDSAGSHNQDLTVFVGGPNASSTTGMTSWVQADGPHALYVDANQHLNQFWNDSSGWHGQDLTVFVSGPHASATTGMTSWIQADGPHALYVDVNQHVNQFWNDSGGSHNQDLTVFVGGPSASPATGMTSWIQSDGPHALYVDSNQHVDQLWNDASGWHTQDLTVFVSGPDASPATSFTSWIQPDGPHALYVDSNQHVDQLWNDASGWHWQDLTATVNGPLAAVPDTISGQVTAGGSGFSGVTVSLSGTTAAGTAVSRSTTTDANGNYSLAAPAGGSYTVTPSLAGFSFSPASKEFSNIIANQTQSFSLVSGTAPGTPGVEPVPDPTPTPTPPPATSGSMTNCNDISGTWVDSVSNDWSLSQSGSAVSGTVNSLEPGCGVVTGTVQGQATGLGTFSLTATAPATDACGVPFTSRSATESVIISGCSQAQATIGSGTGATGFLGSGGGSGNGGTVTWSRSSTPPGLQLNVDLYNGKVGATLTGQNKVGNFSLVINGAGQSTILGQQNSAGTSSLTFSLKRTALNPGQYSSVVATWDDINLTVPVAFKVLGPTRFSTYNVPVENGCSGNPTPVWIFENDVKSCLVYSDALMSDFYAATNLNGTGQSISHGLLKPYDATWLAKFCSLPPGATNGKNGNTFVRVSSVTGSCKSVLSAGVSLATSPNPNPTNATWKCSDGVLLVNSGSDQTDSIKMVQDNCPACSGDYRGQDGHIDTFSSYKSCGGHDAADYGNFTTIRLR